MSSRVQAENVIKSIIREISQECSSKGQAVSETLVAFMVKAVVLDPENQFNVDRNLTKDDVQHMIKLCVQRLLDTQSFSLDTIKLQVYYDMNYTTRNEFLEEHRRVLESRLQPVVREITDSRARTREEMDSLYRKIVSAVLLRSGLGSPTDIAVVRETTAALQSVFPQTELATFIALTKKEKERHLLELTWIVTGIRLFNKECGKGGQGIDDLPGILDEAVTATAGNLENELNTILQQSSRYTCLVEKCYASEKVWDQAPAVGLLKEALVNCRQHEYFLRILLSDVLTSGKQVLMLQDNLRQRMEALKSTVQSKLAVPTSQVYPHFIHLSHAWTGFQDEMVLLSVLSNILVSLEPFTRLHSEVFPSNALMEFLEPDEVISDQQRIEKVSKDIVEDDEVRNSHWLFPDNTKNFDKLSLQYRGFCAYSIVKYDRFVVPGNPYIGVLEYKNRYYVFSTKHAAIEFAQDPKRFIQLTADAAKKSPELIQLLDLHSQFAAITPYTSNKQDKKGMIEKAISMTDSGTQTCTHFMESNIVKSYEWNEWELRRKAIRLTNLRKKLTSSVQTNLSNFKRNNDCQVYLPKEQETQTKTDSRSVVPRPQVFLASLCGMPLNEPTRMTKVDLTLDPEVAP